MLNLKLLAATGLAAMLCACASTSGTPATGNVTSRIAEPGSPEEMICRNERITGQMIPRRVCMTRAERDALEREADEMFAEESVRHLRINPQG